MEYIIIILLIINLVFLYFFWQRQEQQEQAPQTGGEGGGATATLASIEGTTWKSADGAATLDVLPGVRIESEGGTDSLSYFEASDVTESALGL
ncbi:hypothetical protein MBN61_03630, partial [Candidatus Saccharibacteria bacterium]|nr:hypothetical protein [Candidatus Saccharibacteria bacterium]